MTHRVFVYGTLKQGQPNHYIMKEAPTGTYKFVGRGRTETRWPLVIASQYNIPFLLDIEGEGHNVMGEVYEVDDLMFKELDALEGYPGYYDRRLINIRMDKMADGSDSSEVIQSWIYFLPRFKDFMKDLERYENYDSFGPHGKEYVGRVRVRPNCDLGDGDIEAGLCSESNE